MSESARPALKWHQLAGLLLLVPLTALSIWTLADPAPAAGWLYAVMGLFLLTYAHGLSSAARLGRARWWLSGLTIALAAIQLWAGFALLLGSDA